MQEDKPGTPRVFVSKKSEKLSIKGFKFTDRKLYSTHISGNYKINLNSQDKHHLF